MKIIFIKNHDNFVAGNICDVLNGKAYELIKLNIAEQYHGQNVEVYPQQEQEPEKEMVYVPIIIPENEIFSQAEMEEEINVEEELLSVDKPNKFKSKLK
jgi:hypothetical protein